MSDHNQILPTYRQKMLLGQVSWSVATIRCLALTTELDEADIENNVYAYVADLPADDVLDVPSDIVTNTAVSSLGVAECSDIVFTGLTSGSRTVQSFVIYEDTGASNTDLLIAYIPLASGMPFTAGGGITTLSRPSGEAGFFRA